MPRPRWSFFFTLLAWLVLLGGLGVAVWYMQWLGRDERVARARYDATSKAAYALGLSQREHISDLKVHASPKMLTRSELLAAVPQAASAQSVVTEMPDGSTR